MAVPGGGGRGAPGAMRRLGLAAAAVPPPSAAFSAASRDCEERLEAGSALKSCRIRSVCLLGQRGAARGGGAALGPPALQARQQVDHDVHGAGDEEHHEDQQPEFADQEHFHGRG